MGNEGNVEAILETPPKSLLIVQVRREVFQTPNESRTQGWFEDSEGTGLHFHVVGDLMIIKSMNVLQRDGYGYCGGVAPTGEVQQKLNESGVIEAAIKFAKENKLVVMLGYFVNADRWLGKMFATRSDFKGVDAHSSPIDSAQ